MLEFEDLRSKSEIISRMKRTINLPENLCQLEFFRAVRHLRQYRIRDSLIGIKIDLEDGGVGHFMVGATDNDIKILVETSKY